MRSAFGIHPTFRRLVILVWFMKSSKYFSTKVNKHGQVNLISIKDSNIANRFQKVRMTLDLGLLPDVLSEGTWQPEISDFLLEGLKKNQKVLILDLGAHSGIISRQILVAVQRNRGLGIVPPILVCVEPNPLEFRNLVINLRDFPDVNFFNVAIHPHLTSVQLTSDWINSGNSTVLSNTISGARQKNIFEVQCVNLQELINKFSTDCPIILKSDIEGLDIVAMSSFDINSWDRLERFVVELYGDVHDDLMKISSELQNFNLFWPDSRSPISLLEILEKSKTSFSYSSDLFAIKRNLTPEG